MRSSARTVRWHKQTCCLCLGTLRAGTSAQVAEWGSLGAYRVPVPGGRDCPCVSCLTQVSILIPRHAHARLRTVGVVALGVWRLFRLKNRHETTINAETTRETRRPFYAQIRWGGRMEVPQFLPSPNARSLSPTLTLTTASSSTPSPSRARSSACRPASPIT